MSRYLDIDACIQAARLTAAAGEMAPFPFIKGAAQCVVLALETIDYYWSQPQEHLSGHRSSIPAQKECGLSLTTPAKLLGRSTNMKILIQGARGGGKGEKAWRRQWSSI
ncbi:hypothetical protein IW262DRAFT_1301563 [Armillaria fumosa]|nr:hypothetical protein IW262DRAFT_1301563 [Armillaria fumosa]